MNPQPRTISFQDASRRYAAFQDAADAHSDDCGRCAPGRLCKYGHLVALRIADHALNLEPETTEATSKGGLGSPTPVP